MAECLEISKSYYAQLENGNRPLTTELENKVKERFFAKEDKECRLKASFDWVSLHFIGTDAREVAERILGLDLDWFLQMDYSRYHYSQYYSYGAINLYDGGKTLEQGTLIELSGTGCREMEALLEEQHKDWYDVFNDCLLFENTLRERMHLPQGEKDEEQKSPRKPEKYFNATRLDLALDELYSKDGNYSLYDLRDKLEQGLVGMTKHKYNFYHGGNYSPNGSQKNGLTIYIGDKKSKLYFRFYEKDMERAHELQLSVDDIHDLQGLKNRYEIVLKREKSDQFVREYVATAFDIALQGVMIINGNITVFEDTEGHLDPDWFDLMSTLKAYKFHTSPKKPDLEKTWGWAMKAVFPTLSGLKKADHQRYAQALASAEIPERIQHYIKIKKLKEEKGSRQ